MLLNNYKLQRETESRLIVSVTNWSVLEKKVGFLDFGNSNLECP